MPVCFAGIYADMVFIHFDSGWDKLISAGYGIRKLFPSVLPELIDEFLFRQIMGDNVCIKPRKVLIPFAGPLPASFFWQLQVFRLRGIRIIYSFCFIKENDVPVDLHKTDLARAVHLFRGPPKTVFLCKDELFHHQLHLFVQVVDFLCQCL